MVLLLSQLEDRQSQTRRTATNGDVGKMDVSGMKRIMEAGVGKALVAQLLHDMAAAVAEMRNQQVLMGDGSAVTLDPHLVREERDLVLRMTTGVLRSEAGAIVMGMLRDLGLHRAMKWIAVMWHEVETCHHLVEVLLSESRAGLLLVGPSDEDSLLSIENDASECSTTVVLWGKQVSDSDALSSTSNKSMG